jgi:hypothetical protein
MARRIGPSEPARKALIVGCIVVDKRIWRIVPIHDFNGGSYGQLLP